MKNLLMRIYLICIFLYRGTKLTKLYTRNFELVEMLKLQNAFGSGRSNWNVSCGCFASSNNSSGAPNTDLMLKTCR